MSFELDKSSVYRSSESFISEEGMVRVEPKLDIFHKLGALSKGIEDLEKRMDRIESNIASIRDKVVAIQTKMDEKAAQEGRKFSMKVAILTASLSAVVSAIISFLLKRLH